MKKQEKKSTDTRRSFRLELPQKDLEAALQGLKDGSSLRKKRADRYLIS